MRSYIRPSFRGSAFVRKRIAPENQYHYRKKPRVPAALFNDTVPLSPLSRPLPDFETNDESDESDRESDPDKGISSESDLEGETLQYCSMYEEDVDGDEVVEG